MKKLSPLKIIIIFLVSGQLWILLTDLLVANVATSPEMFTRLSIMKGWLYNAVLGLLLYWLISRYASERDRAEEALRNSEQSYKTLSENLPGIIYRVFMRENNRMQFFNKTSFDIIGYLDSELSEGIVCSLEKLILDEDRPNVIAVVEKAITEHKQFSVEYRLRHKDGTIRFMLEKGAPVYGPDEKILYIDGVIFDITERKRFEQQTDDALNFIRTMMENSPVGVVSIKATGAVVATNEAMARISGGTVDQLLKQNVRSLEAWKNCGLLSAMDEALATNSEKRIETKYVSTFGKDVWLSASFVPFTFQGEPHVLAMFADMSERKRDEIERERLLTQLMQAQKMDAIGQLAGGVAHDFNNILTAIIGYGSILQKKMTASDPLRINVDHIIASAGRAARAYTQSPGFQQKTCPEHETDAPERDHCPAGAFPAQDHRRGHRAEKHPAG